MPTRLDGRSSDTLRPTGYELRVQKNPEGSLIYRSGETAVLISASVSEGSPDWLRTPGHGWLTAEYAMHPRANPHRQRRERKPGGRSSEIQRLIGRSLRACLALDKLGERTIHIDCDVLDADGGTRTASITGGFIATAMALSNLQSRGLVIPGVLREPIAAISVGLLEGSPMLDLCYTEDRDAEVDLNVVGTAGGDVVEVQGTAEGAPMPRAKLDAMLDVALGSMKDLVEGQKRALEEAGVDLGRLMA